MEKSTHIGVGVGTRNGKTQLQFVELLVENSEHVFLMKM